MSYPRFRPELSESIEGSLGRYSQFNEAFGYYADGVSSDTATLPDGWEARLVRLSNENTGGAIGWCLEPHDLAFSKLVARRDKDMSFVQALLRYKMVRPSRLQKLIDTVADPSLHERLSAAFAACTRRG